MNFFYQVFNAMLEEWDYALTLDELKQACPKLSEELILTAIETGVIARLMSIYPMKNGATRYGTLR